MIKILPINKKPSMRTYTHHAFLHSIISSDDKVEKNEQSITEFSVVDYELREWKCEKRNIRYERVDNNFVVWGNKWNTDMDVVFWRPCRNLDSIEIEIHKQLYSNVWSGISIFITKKNTDMINNIVCTDVRVGSFSKDGVYFVLANQSHKVLKRNWLNNRIKLIREDQSVYMLFQETEEVSRIDLVESLDSEEYVIGFAATFGCNSFYEWKFSNYINVAINFNRPVIMDFIWNTNKNWSPHSSDYFIDYQCEDRDSVNLFGYSELDFVKQMIQAGRYIEVEINNNLNVGISDEEGPVFHQNLIYGFDDEKACLYLLYVKYGQIVTNQLAYEEFESERNQQYNRKYYVYRYNPGYEGWNLSVSHILQLFEEFSSSINISNYFSGQEEFFCGIIVIGNFYQKRESM